jgi:hypothetical protein
MNISTIASVAALLITVLTTLVVSRHLVRSQVVPALGAVTTGAGGLYLAFLAGAEPDSGLVGAIGAGIAMMSISAVFGAAFHRRHAALSTQENPS